MWYPEPGVESVLTTLVIIFLVLNFISVSLRCYVRLVISKSFSYDDYAMVAGFASYAAMCATLLAAMIYGYGATYPQPGYNPLKAGQSLIAFQLVYVVAAYACKLSAGLVLLRIAGTDKKSPIRITLLVSIVIITIFAIATFLTLALQCRPLSLAWGVGEGTCVEGYVITNIAYAFSASDIASGWLYATLPIVMLWRVQLSIRVKLSVILLLGLGFTSSIATLVRLKYVVDLESLGSSDPSQPLKLLTSIIWSHLEIALAILAASLAALRPLLKFITNGHGSYADNKKSAGWSEGISSRNKMGSSAIRMDTWNEVQSDSGSQEFVLPKTGTQKSAYQNGDGIYKHTTIEISRQNRGNDV
ncbi:hypothetical protein F5Y18DRAFT_240930 [Xylariaceae sp. FL1019]|nr:hypothetical protein F5Y18DRAFT_240930 [Xylariaceae sp. FL1019]